MPRRLAGVLPIVHTPFLDTDELDTAALRREIDWAFAQGADGLGTGMVSELPRLTSAERQQLTELIVELAAGRGPRVCRRGRREYTASTRLRPGRPACGV